MYEKILIQSELRVLTGLHIGGTSVFSSIGAVDSPVVTDKRTQLPIIPGSSLKGKLRTLLVRSLVEKQEEMKEPNKDDKEVRRLFGSSANGDQKIEKARLQFSDAYICEESQKEFKEIGLTEVKFENGINRASMVATPRQIERVVSGVRFHIPIVYDLVEKQQVQEDMTNIAKAMKLLQMDYLGGHGTRGSGRVSFENISLSVLTKGDGISQEELIELENLFKEVESYELLSI